MKTKRIIAGCIATILSVGAFAGCGGKKNDGKVEFTIGTGIAKSSPNYKITLQEAEEFNERHPEYRYIPDEYSYDSKNFVAKAAGGTLPTTWPTPFTEIDMIVKNGYCADISEYIKENGILDVYNPDLLNIVRGENGEIWGLPWQAYAQGLHINKKLFKEAGLVNEEGSIKYPNTWEELSDFAKIIKDKTGKAGFLMPTTDNCGGWHFINVAWSYGTEFMKQTDDGKWVATFDSPEFKKACEWLYDLRWNKDAIYTDKTAITNGDREQIFGTYQAGMMLANPPAHMLSGSYGMDVADIACCRIPAGPKGRIAQSGGGVYFFNANATPEEIRGAMTYFYETTFSPKVTPESYEITENIIKQQVELNYIILDRPEAFPKYTDYEGFDKIKELYKKYQNTKDEDYEDYFSFEDVIIKPEEPVCCQQLYAVMDGIVQEILTNKNVDLDAVIKKAQEDFQLNHLNNI